MRESRGDTRRRRHRRAFRGLACAGALAGAGTFLGPGGSAVAAPSCETTGATTVCTYATVGADTFTAPAGVAQATFDAFGAQGGGFGNNPGGGGGHARATIAVTQDQVLTITVGGGGGHACGSALTAPNPGEGGFNGGAPGTYDPIFNALTCASAGGGGASDVRAGAATLADRLLVAGGGGGVGTSEETVGGGGGGLTGQAGAGPGGGAGGDQTGDSGSGLPGVGSAAVSSAGGGGGGGWYGGGGGDGRFTNGGGGSGFGPPGTLFETGVRLAEGADLSADGLVTVTYTVTGAGLLADLRAAVQGVGPGTSLRDKVARAQSELAAGNASAACSTLSAFVKEVKVQSGRSIPGATAIRLTALAQEARGAIGCA